VTAEAKLTYFSKNKIQCPICENTFYREDLLTGRGRLIAGDLTDELRRLYDASDKFGIVYPLIYPVTVCPACYYAAFPGDFLDIDPETKREIDLDADKRLRNIGLILDDVDFREPRGLKEGAASYYFAMMCYDFAPDERSPTIKQGLCALRGAWLMNDLALVEPDRNFERVAELFYRKARFFYNQAIEYEQNGKESLSGIAHLGPDLDKNYGYDGVLYLSAYLELRYGPREDSEKYAAALKTARRTCARIFGMGKASKNKPSVILDRARSLYERLGQELERSGEDGDS